MQVLIGQDGRESMALQRAVAHCVLCYLLASVPPASASRPLLLGRGDSDKAKNLAPDVPDDCNTLADPIKNLIDSRRWDLFLELVLVVLVVATVFAWLFYTVGRLAKPRRPSYWKFHFLCPHRDQFYEEVDVTEEMREPVERLIDMTTNKEAMGQGRDGKWATHKRLRVLKVTRIENGPQWTKYATVRSAMHPVKKGLEEMPRDMKKYTQYTLELQKSIFSARDKDPAVASFLKKLGLDESRNERLLLHGSPGVGARGADGNVLFPSDEFSPAYAIKHGGFDDRLGNVKGMYGAGTYFADMASKADQYAGQYNPPGTAHGSLGEKATMFLSRVSLGCPFLTNFSMEQLRRPPCVHGHFDLNLYWNEDVKIGKPWWQKNVQFRVCEHVRFDSVMADFKVDDQQRLYREYIVYEQQAYPEFCVTYSREQ
mmetsp:Transcript_9151/g.20376  ORF Transcript_9151/g.20376 Transcript_9151/m.20376 type:complete len:427 (-) Transcript_9151:87-1367(-)